LIELPVARRLGIALLKTPHQPSQLRDFLGPLPGVPAEKRYQNDQSDREGFESKRERANAVPGHYGEND
jgi:hypothetical protein